MKNYKVYIKKIYLMSKMKNLLANKKPNMGGDIHFIVKKGKVTVLTAE